MKNLSAIWILMVSIGLTAITSCGNGNPPVLGEGVYLQEDSVDLASGSFSVPVVYDWNSDGKKDLLVGHKDIDSNGAISFFENIGTDVLPSFNGSALVMSCDASCSPLFVTGGG